MHVHGGDGPIVVSRVIIYAPRQTHAAGVDGDLVGSVRQTAQPPGLIYGTEDVEKLADAGVFVRFRQAVGDGKGSTDEPGLGGQISGKSHTAEPPAVGGERKPERICGIIPGQMAVVVQLEHLIGEGRIVGQNACRVVVDLKPLGGGFHGDGAGGIGENPVQLGSGQLRAEGRSGQVQPGKQCPGLRQSGTLAEYPGNQGVLRHVVLSRDGLVRIPGVAHKVESRHAQSLFVHGVIVQGIPTRHMGHAENGIVTVFRSGVPEGEGEVPGSEGDLLSVREFIIQRPSKIGAFRFVTGCGTHKNNLLRESLAGG